MGDRILIFYGSYRVDRQGNSAQLVKIYGSAPGPAGRYGPAECTEAGDGSVRSAMIRQ